MVVPNLGEAEALLGLSQGHEAVDAVPDARNRAVASARGLVAAGAEAAVVTAAAAGAAFAGRDGGAGWVPAPPVSVRNPIGAGDAFTAALASRFGVGAALSAAVVYAVGAGSASVESPLAGGLDPERARTLAAQIAAEPTAA
jgi:sugar/nucleoside kinase (ribokinase family)